MNIERIHFEAEIKAKAYIRTLFADNGLGVVDMELTSESGYAFDIARLAGNILKWQVQEAKEKDKTNKAMEYCKTQSLDWE